ncbi:MAG: hypothetical protein K6B68_03090 [Eubacterium sp.]|nr:hypothetical protein [Eubacterium sp.]
MGKLKKYVAFLKAILLVLAFFIQSFGAYEVEAAGKYNKRKLYKAYYNALTESVKKSKKKIVQYQESCLKDINRDGIPEMICRYINTEKKSVFVSNQKVNPGEICYTIFYYNKKNNRVNSFGFKVQDENEYRKAGWKRDAEYNPKTKEIIRTILKKDSDGMYRKHVTIYRFNKKLNKHTYVHSFVEKKDNCCYDNRILPVSIGLGLIMSNYQTKDSVKFSKLQYQRQDSFLRKLKNVK